MSYLFFVSHQLREFHTCWCTNNSQRSRSLLDPRSERLDDTLMASQLSSHRTKWLDAPHCWQIEHVTRLQSYPDGFTGVAEVTAVRRRALWIPHRAWYWCCIIVELQFETFRLFHPSSRWQELLIHAWRLDWRDEYEMLLPYQLAEDILIGVSMHGRGALGAPNPHVDRIRAAA